MWRLTVAFEIPMNDVLGVEIVHALRSLTGDIDDVLQLEPSFGDMQMLVERRTLTPLRHDGQLRV